MDLSTPFSFPELSESRRELGGLWVRGLSKALNLAREGWGLFTRGTKLNRALLSVKLP